jgi:hypothetical protein
MMVAVLPPAAVAGIILNDIGPVMEPRGLMRIKSYVGKLPIANLAWSKFVPEPGYEAVAGASVAESHGR